MRRRRGPRSRAWCNATSNSQKKRRGTSPAAPLNNAGLERLAQCHADGARLVGRESETSATTPFPVEGEQRLLVGHVVHVDDCGKSTLEVHPCAEVDQVVFGQLE